MVFKLSKRSETKLLTVDLALSSIVRRAIAITSVDFTVLEGARTIKRQRELVATGASQTMKSRHIPPRPGDYARAVDLGAYIGGELRWDWPLYYRIAVAMREACREANVVLTWGGVWDRKLNDLQGDPGKCVAGYVTRQEKKGRDAFIDGPHYELDAR